MPRNRGPVALAGGGAAALAAVAVWGSTIVPERGLAWLMLGGFLPSLWAYVEVAQERGSDPEVAEAGMTFHRYVVAFGGFMLAGVVGSKLMVRAGGLDPSWLPTVERVRWLASGGGMVVFGNLLPTMRSPWPHRRQPFAWQQVHRFVGWTFVMGGLAIIASQAFLPANPAERFSLGVMVVVLTLALGRKFASWAATSFRPLDPAD